MELPKHLKNRLNRRTLSHAYVLVGDKRRDCAQILAEGYVCTGEGDAPCGICPNCRKARAGIHPDVISLSAELLKVDDIRTLRRDAYIKPNEAMRKVYILEHAETMNAAGQNVMLKLLEEGPAYTAFLLLTPNPEILLATVRSRCETIDTAVEETEAASELAILLMADDPLPLVRYCIGLEKKSREEMIRLLDETRRHFISAVKPEQWLGLLDELDEIRAVCEYNIGMGHVAGWLMTVRKDGGFYGRNH
ncbi:MAG: hypothetical protein RR053_00250 [Evtepia sp.]